jgi:hypothetical protein
MASPETAWYTTGVDLASFHRGVVEPVRYLSDIAGGNAWHSYAVVAAIDAVGGDSNTFPSWLAIPEASFIVHVPLAPVSPWLDSNKFVIVAVCDIDYVAVFAHWFAHQ